MKTDILITPALLAKVDAPANLKAWATPIIGDGMPLLELLPRFDRADWLLWLIPRVCHAIPAIVYVRIAVVVAESVIGIYEAQYPDDIRPRKAIDAAKAYAAHPTTSNGDAAANAAYGAIDAADMTDAGLEAADSADAATAAAYAAYAAGYAAEDAAYGAYAATRAAETAYATACVAARLAAYVTNPDSHASLRAAVQLIQEAL